MRHAAKITLSLAFSLLLSAPSLASDYPLFNVLDEKSATKLQGIKIFTTSDLLRRTGTPLERKKLAKRTGITRGKITTWARLCDLLRIKGVGLKMARLLTRAEVRTVRELRQAQPLALHKKVLAANKKKEITKTPPTAEQLFNWIEQSKKLKLVFR